MAASVGATTSSAAYYDYNTTVSEDLTALTTTHSTEFYPWTSITWFLKRYYIWIIFAFGFPGNIFCVFVIIRMSKRHISTSLLYVAFLAIIDIITILLKLLKNQAYYSTIVVNETSCQILTMFGSSIATYANWVLIVMAAERFTAVRFPLKVSLIWTVRKAIIIMFVVFIVIVLIHFHMFFTITHHEHYMCTFKKEYDVIFTTNWYYVSSAVYFLIPAAFLMVFNILIIYLLKLSGIKRRNMLSGGDAAVVEAQRQERQITIMLVTVTVVFVVLTLPTCIYVLLYYQWMPQDGLGQAQKAFVGILTSSLANTNHAINFYLYFLAGKRFREKSFSILTCKKKLHKYVSEETTSTRIPPTTQTGL